MFLLRARRIRRDEQPPNAKLLLWLLVAILVAFLLLRFWSWLNPAQRSLLPTAATPVQDVATLVPVPAQTFGADLYAVGLYTRSVEGFPRGTLTVIYVRDGWRFVEIDYLPDLVAETYLATHPAPTQEIKLDQERSVWIQTIDTHPRCINYDDDLPNRCEISRHLITDLDDRLLLIAADGTNATDGELIEMTRSILDQ